MGGLTASFTATGQGFSIQAADVLGFTPAGFSGNCIYPDSIYPADLQVAFSQKLSNFSIMYSPEEYGCDSSATMRVTADLNGVYVGTNTATAYPPGTWPTGTLTFNSNKPVNSVVIHHDAPPPTGGDCGPVFMADNMIVTPTGTSPAPEPSTLALLGIGAGGLVPYLWRRRRCACPLRAVRGRTPAPDRRREAER